MNIQSRQLIHLLCRFCGWLIPRSIHGVVCLSVAVSLGFLSRFAQRPASYVIPTKCSGLVFDPSGARFACYATTSNPNKPETLFTLGIYDSRTGQLFEEGVFETPRALNHETPNLAWDRIIYILHIQAIVFPLSTSFQETYVVYDFHGQKILGVNGDQQVNLLGEFLYTCNNEGWRPLQRSLTSFRTGETVSSNDFLKTPMADFPSDKVVLGYSYDDSCVTIRLHDRRNGQELDRVAIPLLGTTLDSPRRVSSESEYVGFHEPDLLLVNVTPKRDKNDVRPHDFVAVRVHDRKLSRADVPAEFLHHPNPAVGIHLISQGWRHGVLVRTVNYTQVRPVQPPWESWDAFSRFFREPKVIGNLLFQYAKEFSIFDQSGNRLLVFSAPDQNFAISPAGDRLVRFDHQSKQVVCHHLQAIMPTWLMQLLVTFTSYILLKAVSTRRRSDRLADSASRGSFLPGDSQSQSNPID